LILSNTNFVDSVWSC